ATVEEVGVEKIRDVFELHRAIADAALRGFDLDQRLEETGTTGAVADDGDVETAVFGFGGESVDQKFGAQGGCGGFAGNVDADTHLNCSPWLWRSTTRRAT